MNKEAEKFFNQGNAHFEAKEFDLAIKNYKQAIELNPRSC
ncbi:MAG: tetratricopeptide repeat protein [Methylococcales symbiont of Hymedesmia sp. n. MRB-2018]|nr:MAG: tetratricopeptide repeat protein [Methylococcales symbiont of Hymedesmia sp. n. MRB-2018]